MKITRKLLSRDVIRLEKKQGSVNYDLSELICPKCDKTYIQLVIDDKVVYSGEVYSPATGDEYCVDCRDRREMDTFYAAYNEKGKVMGISGTERGAKEVALHASKYRWTEQTFDKDWSYLEADGWKVLKTHVAPTPKGDQ